MGGQRRGARQRDGPHVRAFRTANRARVRLHCRGLRRVRALPCPHRLAQVAALRIALLHLLRRDANHLARHLHPHLWHLSDGVHRAGAVMMRGKRKPFLSFFPPVELVAHTWRSLLASVTDQRWALQPPGQTKAFASASPSVVELLPSCRQGVVMVAWGGPRTCYLQSNSVTRRK